MFLVIVFDPSGDAMGICTTKEILRGTLVPGAGLCSPSAWKREKDVMTPNPDCAYLNTTISDALLAMKEERWLRGCFLHLPALDEEGNVVALMDVLQVTYGVVHKMKSVHASQDG